jgi:hypothetical protein
MLGSGARAGNRASNVDSDILLKSFVLPVDRTRVKALHIICHALRAWCLRVAPHSMEATMIASPQYFWLPAAMPIGTGCKCMKHGAVEYGAWKWPRKDMYEDERQELLSKLLPDER